MRWLLALLLSFPLLASGDELAERYNSLGEFILLQVPSAPFPHPLRADGHKYRDQHFAAADHYSDDTVAVFLPKGMPRDGAIDCIVHFHGWHNNVTNVLSRYELIEQLGESGRGAMLIIPQGPRNAPDSFGGKLEDPGGFAKFLDEVVVALRKTNRLGSNQLGKIILSGHSGGYQVISSILAQESERIREVWLFDGLYARSEKFSGWFQSRPDIRFVNIYTANGGTKAMTESLLKTLQETKTPLHTTNELSVGYDELRTNRLLFLFTDLPHDDVVEKRRTFRLLAQSSSLREIPDHKLIVAPPKRAVPGQHFPLKLGTLYVPDFFKPSSNKTDVVLFFHGAAWCAEQNFYDAHKNAVLVSVSGKDYGELFKDPARFDSILSDVTNQLAQAKICDAGVDEICLASFSGGYSGVREILRNPQHADRITHVILADSLYAPRDKKDDSSVDTTALAPFLKFAKRAVDGKAQFWFSQLYPPEEKHRSNTTTLTAAYLIEQVKAERRPGNTRNAQGALALYRADKGGFHVLGYAGMNNQDHFDHFYALSDLLQNISFTEVR